MLNTKRQLLQDRRQMVMNTQMRKIDKGTSLGVRTADRFSKTIKSLFSFQQFRQFSRSLTNASLDIHHNIR